MESGNASDQEDDLNEQVLEDCLMLAQKMFTDGIINEAQRDNLKGMYLYHSLIQL